MILTISESAKEAIALAYLNAQDISGKTPEELTHIYFDALVKVNNESRKINDEQPKREQKIHY